MGLRRGTVFSATLPNKCSRSAGPLFSIPAPLTICSIASRPLIISNATGVPITAIISEQVENPLILGVLIKVMFSVESIAFNHYGSFYKCQAFVW
ncbi:MAG: hypothetical protein JHD26_14385 [Gemmataceae bacterium]|nr:hypothetical protein [Gemmataceae bacterium]